MYYQRALLFLVILLLSHTTDAGHPAGGPDPRTIEQPNLMLYLGENLNDENQEVDIDVCKSDNDGYSCVNGDTCGNAKIPTDQVKQYRDSARQVAGLPYSFDNPVLFRIMNRNAICLSRANGVEWKACNCDNIGSQLFVLNNSVKRIQDVGVDDAARGMPVSHKDDLQQNLNNLNNEAKNIGFYRVEWAENARWKFNNKRFSCMNNAYLYVPEAARELAVQEKTTRDYMAEQKQKDELRRADEERAVQDGELKLAATRRSKVDQIVQQEIKDSIDRIKAEKDAEIVRQKQVKTQKLKDAQDARKARDDRLKMELMTLDNEIKDAQSELGQLKDALASLQEQKVIAESRRNSKDSEDSFSATDSDENSDS